MKVVYALLTSIFLGFGAKAEILETKTVDNGGNGMFKPIAVKDSEMPDLLHPDIYCLQLNIVVGLL